MKSGLIKLSNKELYVLLLKFERQVLIESMIPSLELKELFNVIFMTHNLSKYAEYPSVVFPREILCPEQRIC